MKLHLPIALLAAVISAQFVSAEVTSGITHTYNGAEEPVSSDIGSGIYNGHIETVYQGDYSSYKASDGHAAGNISAIPRTWKDSNGKAVNAATSAHVILTGEGSKAGYVIGGGPREYFVTGDKTVTVQDKAFAAYIAGGKSFTSEKGEPQTFTGYKGYTGATYWQPKNSDATITINLKDAACTAIIGGNAQSANAPGAEFQKAVGELGSYEAAREYALSADSAMALDEKVVINVEDGRLGYASYDTAYSKETLYGYSYSVISGAGQSGYSVNNDIDINIKGNSIVNGSIVAGASSYLAKKYGNHVVSAYVGGSTSVSLTDGLVKGNIYGGGDGDAVVKGNTQIVLDGTALVEGDVYGAGRNGDTVLGNTNVVLRGSEVKVNGIISGGGEGDLSTVKGDRVLTFDAYSSPVATVAEGDDYTKVDLSKFKEFNVLEVSDSKVDLGASLKLEGSEKQFESVSVSNGGAVKVADIGETRDFYLNDGTFTTEKVQINTGDTLNIVGKDKVNDNFVLTGTGKEETILGVNGVVNVNNATLAVEGKNSQVAIGYGSAGIMNVKDSVVDISNAQTLHIGYEALTEEQQANTQLNIVNSTFKGGSQNAWLGGGTINVVNSDMEVCTGTVNNNYRVLMGLNENTVNLNVTNGSEFTSNASRFVTNYHNGTTVNILVDGSTFTQAEIARVSRDDGYKGPEDSITYLADRGVDNNGKPIIHATLYPEGLVNNVRTNIAAVNGGQVNFESKMTYVGNANDLAAGYTDKEVNFLVGKDSSVSFKQMDIYAKTNVNFIANDAEAGIGGTKDGSFNATKLVVNKGATLNITGSKDHAGSFVLTGTGIKDDEALVVDGTVNVTNTNLTIKGYNSQLGIGYGANGGTLVVSNSTVDMHESSTLHMGYDAGKAGVLIIEKGSKFTGASNNAWLGGGKVAITDGSSLDVCNSTNDYNYRTIMGWEGHTLDMLVDGKSSFTTAATQLVTNYHSNTKVNIEVTGESTFTHEGEIHSGSSYYVGASGEWVEKDGKLMDKDTVGRVASGEGTKNTITYLLDSGTDEFGAKRAAVNNVETNITVDKGSKFDINSAVTYVGSVQDKALGYTDKELNFKVGEKSSVSFNRMEVYADTNVDFTDKSATFSATDVALYDGATFSIEGAGSVTLEELSMSGNSTMLSGGQLTVLEDLAIQDATLAFVANELNYDAAALTLGSGDSVASITSLENVNFHIIFDNDEVYAQKGENYGPVDFSVALFDLSNVADGTIETLMDALSTGSVTLATLDGEGNEVAMTLKGAELALSGDGKSVVLSGSMVIPEPTTATLSLLALAALAARRRRK